LDGKTINGKKERTRIIIDFPHEFFRKEIENNGRFGTLTLFGYKDNNSYDYNKDSNELNWLRADLKLSLPKEMLNNLIRLTDNRFIGFETSIKWDNSEYESKNNDNIIGKIIEAHFVHQVSSMYDVTGRVPKKNSDHFNYEY